MVRPQKSLLRLFPLLTLAVFLSPVLIGLGGTWLPAFGFLPSLGSEQLSLNPYLDLLAHPSVPGALRATLFSGLSATLLSLLLTLWITIHIYGTGLWTLLVRSLAPLLAIPHAAFALGFSFLIAPSGWLIRLVSPGLTGFAYPPNWTTAGDPLGVSLTLTMVLKEVPFLLLMTIGALNQLDIKRTVWVGRSLGYQRYLIWLKLIIPQLYPLIRLPVLTVLAYSLSVVDLALIIGPTLPPPLAVLIDQWFNEPDLSMRFIGAAGATLLFLLIIVCIIFFLLAELFIKRIMSVRQHTTFRRSFLGKMQTTAGAGSICFLLISGLSLIILIIWSLTSRWRFPTPFPQSFSLYYWSKSLPLIAEPLLTAALIGVCSTMIAITLVIGCLENELLLSRSRLDSVSRNSIWILYLPLLIPQIGFLFGIQTVFTWLRLEGTWFSLIWVHLVFVLPYTFLTLASTYRSFDQRYSQLGIFLSGSVLTTFFRIKLPMLLKPILFSCAVGFAVSIAQYLPTLYVGAGRFATITTETVSLSSGSDRRVIAVYALCQFMLPFLIYTAAIWFPALVFRNRPLMKN